MLTQCEWTSGVAIPQLQHDTDGDGIAEARRLTQQLAQLLASKRETSIPAKLRQPVLQIEGQACATQGDGEQPALLVETAELLSKCEKDLGVTRSAVVREHKLAGEYRGGIQKLRRRRLMEMGGEVQREHEACLANILELQWHVSHTERKLKVLRDDVRMKRRQHSLLKESEDHMTEHSPLVREKGNAEKSLSSSIQSDLESTESEIREREGVRAEKRGVWERKQQQAARARAQMSGERRKLEAELEQAVRELREAEEEGKSLGEEMEESVRTRERNQRECKELRKQEEGCISTTESLVNSIKNMELHLQNLKQQVSEYKQRCEENERQLAEEIAVVEREEAELKEDVRSSNTRLHEVRDENETLIQDIDTFKQNRERGKKETKDNTNAIGRIQNQMVTLEAQVSVAEEEATAMRELHQDMMLKVRELENNVNQEETEIKKERERIDKGLKEENHVFTVTQVKVQVEEKSLEKLTEQLQSKRETIGRVLSETERSRDTQRSNTEDIRSRYEEIRNGITETENQLKELREKRESHVRELTKDKSVLIPERDGLTSKLSEMRENSDKTEADIKYNSHKLDDVTASSVMMEGMTGKLGEEIEEMSSDQERVQKGLDKEKEERAVLENEKEELKLFVNNLRENHVIFVKDKRSEIEKAEENLSDVIKRNAVLTGEYRREQNSHMSARTKLLQWTDEKLKLVSSLKDHEQLMGIQARMHSTAQEYYRQRGMRAHNQLARLVKEGEGNKERSLGMKHLLGNVMTEIKSFLEVYGRMSAVRGGNGKKMKVKFSDVIEMEPDTRNVSRATLPPIHGTTKQ